MIDREYRWWQHRDRMNYRSMLLRNKPLWKFVRNFIKVNGVHSVLEPGCGEIPPARRWVPNYTGIDVNKDTEWVHGDFLTMDLSLWHGMDLLLACGIVEHTGPDCGLFFRRIKELAPKYAIVSFFNGLWRGTSTFKRDARGFWIGGFCGGDILDYLDGIGMNVRLETFDRNSSALVITNPVRADARRADE